MLSLQLKLITGFVPAAAHFFYVFNDRQIANRIAAKFNVLLTHTFVPVAETRISILFLAKRGVEDLNLWSPFRDSVLAGQCIQPNSANTSNSSVVQYYLITTEYKQILTSIIFV